MYKCRVAFIWEGYEIVPNGITMITDMHGRTSGDAYVQFSSQSVADRALEDKHKKRIGHRLVGGGRTRLVGKAGLGRGRVATPGLLVATPGLLVGWLWFLMIGL